MKDVFSYTKCPFVILIDEWDCLFREYKQDNEAQKKYLDFLRAWLKDKDQLLVHLGYLTYNIINGTVSIPNKEVSQEYINAISTMDWYGVANSVEDSRKCYWCD